MTQILKMKVAYQNLVQLNGLLGLVSTYLLLTPFRHGSPLPRVTNDQQLLFNLRFQRPSRTIQNLINNAHAELCSNQELYNTCTQYVSINHLPQSTTNPHHAPKDHTLKYARYMLGSPQIMLPPYPAMSLRFVAILTDCSSIHQRSPRPSTFLLDQSK